MWGDEQMTKGINYRDEYQLTKNIQAELTYFLAQKATITTIIEDFGQI